ncbi:MAG: hypothetical protein Ct9H300mP22_5480 [Gammaproteobacteria bacterium]|nr:MAG: hypothetical protein Ct9H300mP22_5480 [Gammaproteobacteria bacterium]
MVLLVFQNLELTGNSITDISPLAGLPNLARVDLRYNPDLNPIRAFLRTLELAEENIVELRHTQNNL